MKERMFLLRAAWTGHWLLGWLKKLKGEYMPFLKLWPRNKVCQVWSLFITFRFNPTLVIPPRSPCVKDYASSTFLALPSTINLNGQIGQWTTPNASCCCGFALVRMPSWVYTYLYISRFIEERTCWCISIAPYSLIRGVLVQSGSAGAKNFTNYIYFVIHNSVVLSKI